MRIRRRTILIFGCLFGGLTWQSSADSAGEEERYRRLCAYDEWCQDLKDEDGRFVPPRADVLQILGSLHGPLRQVTSALGVDPAAVAGAIVAGNSLGPQIDEDARGFLDSVRGSAVANKLSRLFRGKSFSVGIAQIKPETAGDAEPLLAKLEGRPVRSVARIREALADPLEGVKYTAAIIRQCQDVYRKNGFEVADDPALLATMFNVGGCPRRAAEAARIKRPPRPNFFGFFVRRYAADIARAVGLDAPASPAPAVIATGAPRVVTRRLREAVRLLAAPPECGSGAAHPARANLAVPARGDFKVLAPGLDCDMKDWSLIRTAAGDTGWVADEVLARSAEAYAREAAHACDPRVLAACAARVRAKLGEDALDLTEDGLLDVSLNAKDRLAGLSDESCVETVFSADLALVDAYAKRRGGAYYKPFANPGRFALKLRDGCAHFDSADAGAAATGVAR